MTFWVLVVLVSILLAKVEIQIEGKDGYAKNLPVTWRANRRWVKRFFTGTSYHFYQGLFLLSLVHLPFVIGDWTVAGELLVLSFLAFVTVLEDFLWFVLNPAYGIRKYRKACVPWFGHWYLGVPEWYWVYLPIGILLYIGGRY